MSKFSPKSVKIQPKIIPNLAQIQHKISPNSTQNQPISYLFLGKFTPKKKNTLVTNVPKSFHENIVSRLTSFPSTKMAGISNVIFVIFAAVPNPDWKFTSKDLTWKIFDTNVIYVNISLSEKIVWELTSELCIRKISRINVIFVQWPFLQKETKSNIWTNMEMDRTN